MMNKYNMQCDITLIYSNMIYLISSIFPANIADKRLFKVFYKYNPPTLIYTCGSHDDRRLFIPPKAERM